MLVWTVSVRLPAMRAAGVDIRELIGSKASDADRSLPPNAQWKAHNYNHLLEQPTGFYAVCLTLAIAGAGNGLNAWLAWGYVLLRIAHSIVQATVNKVFWRFQLFALSTLVLVVLTVSAALAVF